MERSPIRTLFLASCALIVIYNNSVEGSPAATSEVRSGVKRLVPQNSSQMNVTAVSDIFVFPDFIPEKKKKYPSTILGVPACAKGKTFCDTIDNYPKGIINKLLPDVLKNFKDLVADEIEDEGIFNKAQDPTTERSLCPSKVEVKAIEAAQTRDGDWRYVINHPNYTQLMRLETCIDVDNNDCTNANLSYQTECKQKYVHRTLVALDNEMQPYPGTFSLPSCCSCVMRINMLKIGTAGGRSRRNP